MINCIFTIYNITKEGKLNTEAILTYNTENNMSAPHVKKLKQFLDMCTNVSDILRCFQIQSKRFGFESDIEFDPFLKINLNLADFLNPKLDDADVLKYCTAPSLEASKNIFVSLIRFMIPKSVSDIIYLYAQHYFFYI